MEMLNNVWAALSTPNEELIKLSSVFILPFIELPLIMYMFIYILNIKATRKQKITYIVLSAITGLMCNFVIPEPYNVVVNYIVMFLLISVFL